VASPNKGVVAGSVHYAYRLGELDILSDTPLPELTSCDPALADEAEPLVIRLQNAAAKHETSPPSWFINLDLADGTRWASRAKTAKGYLLRYHDLADFEVDRTGRELVCQSRSEDVSDLTIRALLVDYVLPLILTLRGKCVLHASAVATEHGACAFAADSGIGKSTLATSLSLAGFAVLTDDFLILERRETVIASPSHPHVKLREDSLDALLPDGTNASPVADYTTKRRLRLNLPKWGSAIQSHPVSRIFFLSRLDASDGGSNAKPRMEALSPRDACMELLGYGMRLDTTDPEMLAREFDFAQYAANHIPMKRLWLPNNLRALGAVREMIEDELRD
jgi:hypothetical protein